MDKLQVAAQFYNEELVNKEFHLRAGKKGKIIEFDIVFATSNFKHLLGLNKLTDIPITQNNTSSQNFRDILTGRLTYNDISQSKYFSEVEQRLENFKDLYKALNGKDLMLKSQHGNFNTIIADFMLTNRDDIYGYAHLFMRKDDEKGYTVPITYIINSDNAYLRNHAERWTVLSVEEVKKNEKTVQEKKQKEEAQTNNSKVEIEPLRIFKQTDEAVLIKLPGATVEQKNPVWLPRDGVLLNKEGDNVVGVREDLQQKYSLKLSNEGIQKEKSFFCKKY